MEIGLQFYTIREYCKDLAGLEESLKRTAEIGYKNVQISGVCEFEPEWLKEKLDKYGLECVLTHVAPAKLLADPVKVAKEHDVFGCDCVGLGGYWPKDGEPFDNFDRDYMAVAKALKENGKYFMYHNHAHEFESLAIS